MTDSNEKPAAVHIYNEQILEEALKSLPNRIPLNENYKLRPLKQTDYDHGYLQLLSQLTTVGQVPKKKFDEMFHLMKSTECYFVTVIEDLNSEKVIASATLFNEFKFIHGGALRGRIEDVVVDSNYRGQKLAIHLLETLKCLAKHLKCYKLTLDCKDQLIPFYQKFGFNVESGRSNFMTIRFDDH